MLQLTNKHIVDTFDALRQQPEIIARAMRAMHRQVTPCVERNRVHAEEHCP